MIPNYEPLIWKELSLWLRKRIIAGNAALRSQKGKSSAVPAVAGLRPKIPEEISGNATDSQPYSFASMSEV